MTDEDADFARAMAASMADAEPTAASMEVDPAVVVAAPGPAFAAGPPATPGPAHVALGGTPATTTVPRESPSQIKDLHFSVVHVNDTLPFQAPAGATVGFLKALIASTTTIASEKLMLLGWPTGASDGDTQLLSNLVGGTQASQHDPVQLFLVVEDLAASASSGSAAPVPMVTSRASSRGAASAASDDFDDDEDVSLGDDSDDDIPDAYFSRSPSQKKAEPGMMIPPGSTNPADFFNSFKRRYGNDVPRFFYGSLGDALREGMKQCKPVIVYLNNDKKMETNIFCAEVLANDLIRSILDENFILWGWDMSHLHVQQAFLHQDAQSVIPLFADTQPSLTTLIKGTTGDPAKLGQLLDYNDIGTVMTHLYQMMEKAAPYVTQLQEQSLGRMQAAALRSEQEGAYERSLRLDKAKTEVAEAEADRKKAEDSAAADAAEQLRITEDLKLQARANIAATVPDEPADGAPDVIKMQFRAPENKRLERRFNDTDTLGNVLDFLAGVEYPADKYLLAQNRPRKVMNDSPRELTLAEAGFGKRELLFIEER